MIYWKNLAFIYWFKILNKLGKAENFKKNIFSSKRILEKNFKINSDFNFIQIGANDGKSFDFLYDFVVLRKSKGLVVEPIKSYYEELEKNYENFPEIKKINKAIHPSEKEIIFYRIAPNAIDKYPEWVKGIASVDPSHHKKLHINTNDIIEEIVSSESLMKLIKENFKYEIIDYFQIDTEGFDYEVLKMMDFSIINPSMIKYEFVNLNHRDNNNLSLLLRKEGYYFFNEAEDTIAIDLKKIRLF